MSLNKILKKFLDNFIFEKTSSLAESRAIDKEKIKTFLTQSIKQALKEEKTAQGILFERIKEWNKEWIKENPKERELILNDCLKLIEWKIEKEKKIAIKQAFEEMEDIDFYGWKESSQDMIKRKIKQKQQEFLNN
jgi:hypothetical protein